MKSKLLLSALLVISLFFSCCFGETELPTENVDSITYVNEGQMEIQEEDISEENENTDLVEEFQEDILEENENTDLDEEFQEGDISEENEHTDLVEEIQEDISEEDENTDLDEEERSQATKTKKKKAATTTKKAATTTKKAATTTKKAATTTKKAATTTKKASSSAAAVKTKGASSVTGSRTRKRILTGTRRLGVSATRTRSKRDNPNISPGFISGSGNTLTFSTAGGTTTIGFTTGPFISTTGNAISFNPGTATFTTTASYTETATSGVTGNPSSQTKFEILRELLEKRRRLMKLKQ